MSLLLLKLTLTPLVIGGATLVARRWGPALGGWVVALPLTSGPVAFYLALEHGPRFAADVALGSLAGGVGQCAFALAYASVAARGWPAALVAAGSSFAVVTVAEDALGVHSLAVLVPLLAVAIGLTLRLLPPGRSVAVAAATPPWDLPVRIVIGTAIVVAVTAAAPVVGPGVSGVLVAYPVVFSILVAFTHHHRGDRAAITAARGLVTGIVGFAVFFSILVVALGTPSLETAVGIGGAFVGAIVAVTLVQAMSFRALHAAPVVAA